MESGIYIIKNNIDNKVYIGQSINIKKRIKNHMQNLKNNRHQNVHLQRAFNKYGEQAFSFDVLEYCTKDMLNNREIYYISFYNSANRKSGYNIELGGNNSLVSKETKNKLMLKKTSRDIKQISLIKHDLANGISRKDIMYKYNISKGNLDSIAQINNYKLVSEELNDIILHQKKKYNDIRNNKVLELLKLGIGNKEIADRLQVSVSVVEKVKYKYPSLKNIDRNKRIDNYDNVIRLKEKGYKPYQISKILKISSSVVYRYYNNIINPNNDLSYKKVNKNVIQKIMELHKKYNYSQIGNIVGLSRTTVKNVIDNYKYVNTEIIF